MAKPRGRWMSRPNPGLCIGMGRFNWKRSGRCRWPGDTCSILRLSGPGPGRAGASGAGRPCGKDPLKPEVWSNQIHGDDVAEVVSFLAGRNCSPPVLLVSDACPALRKERSSPGCGDLVVVRSGVWIDHPRRASGHRGNKRICTDKLKSLGSRFAIQLSGGAEGAV